MEPNEAAKRALIAYRQLDAIVKGGVGVADAEALADSYEQILGTLRQCFSIDKAFTEAVSHLASRLPRADAMNLAFRLEADAKVLFAAAHAFLELYLSAEDKTKAIGFHA